MVELRGVEVAFGAVPVLHGLDLDVAAGSWLALIGPNGAGKTTILRALAGLVPHRGVVAIGGSPVRKMQGRDLAQRIAMVGQEPSMPIGMTVSQYVLLGRSPYLSYLGGEKAADRAIVAETLDQLTLNTFAARPLESLSGGERQRTAIARALVQRAPILLVDEPTSALDLGRQQEVLDLIDSVRRQRGLTVISAMHDLTLAGQYADQLALLVAGRLVACGSPQTVLTEEAIAGNYRARARVRRVGDAMRAVVPDRTMPPPGPREVPREPPRRATIRQRSVVIVNTGDGKGKSTAAFGTVTRAVAQGWPVCVIQFVKSGKWKVGEEATGRKLGVDWWSLGDGFTWDSQDMDRTEAVAREAWRVAREKVESGAYRLVVLDELTYPINWGWIPAREVVEVIQSRPADVNVIATGRDAPDQLIDCADTVTEMRNRKHAFERGVRAIRGIDF